MLVLDWDTANARKGKGTKMKLTENQICTVRKSLNVLFSEFGGNYNSK